MMMSASPGFQCPAAISRVRTSRTWAAVTCVASSCGPRRTASSGSVQEVRPGSSTATHEYGQPGIICAFPFPRPYTWQNKRSGLVFASGRSQFETSQASRIRPSSHGRSGTASTARRSRPTRTSPQFSAGGRRTVELNQRPATRHDVGQTIKRKEPKKKTRRQTG
jgi:hypothetical protein